MEDYVRDWMPCMQAMGIPAQMQPMVSMPEQQLEMMYPRIYHIIYPEVVRHCDMMDMTHGPAHMPTRERLEKIIDDITVKVEVNVDVVINQEPREAGERQLGFGGRRLLRDLVGILLIRELIDRRRRPFFGPPFSGGFGPGFGGGYWYY